MPKKRPENAEKTQFKSGEEAVEAGRKGGIASGEAKRHKKLLRECLEELLNKEITDKKGVSMTGAEALAAMAFKKALAGDLRAFEVVRDTAGQKPVEKVQSSQTVVDMSKFTTEEIKAMLDYDVP